MQTTLSAAAIATVKATVPALRAHGLAITTRMYARLFEDAEIKAMFGGGAMDAEARQPRALAAAVLAYAENVDNLPALAGAVETIAARHVERRVEPRHYEAVARALLDAIADVLGRAATPQVLAAWGDAYWRLAHILQAREAELRAARRLEAAA
jgi:nitric oxide dioxygenase